MDRYALSAPPPETVAEELKFFSPLIQQLLFNRGITTRKAAEQFLNPSYEGLHDPFQIMGMEKAVERILKALKNNERIAIYSDYDHDGIPGGVILHDFFRKIGFANFENYIPHRYEEGYGVNSKAIETLATRGAKLIITVDCGITDVEPVKRANELGIDVVVSDHHLPLKTLPPAFVILNSKQKGDSYPDNMLCGAAVAWKLVRALILRGNFGLKEGWEKWLLDLVGLSTVADMVPLQRENRVLARYGLMVLRKSPRAGLMELIRATRLSQSSLTEDDIGFTLAPRINAASRMADPMDAFKLLSTTDVGEAATLARSLEKLNDARKGAVGAVVREARKHLSEREVGEIVVLGNPSWRPGLLGLAANSVLETYERPVFLWGREGSMAIKGSCRSDGSADMVEMMSAVSNEVINHFGGHALAGGFGVEHEAIHRLEEVLLDAYTRVKKPQSASKIQVDAELSVEDITHETVKNISALAPFGIGNSKPLFIFRNVELDAVSSFGKEKNHLKLSFKNFRGNSLSAIGFFMRKEKFPTLTTNQKTISLIGHLENSFFAGRRDLRLRLVDVV